MSATSSGNYNGTPFANNFDFSGNFNLTQTAAPTMLLDGQLLIGSTALNAGGTHCNISTLTAGTGVTITNGPGTITIGLTGGSAAVEHLTGDSGGQLNPDGSNNFNILGQQASTIAVMDTIGSGSTLKIEDRTWQTQYVVDASSTVGLRGTFTTIQAAITAASSGQTIFIRPGTYTENLTLKAGVDLTAFQCDSSLNGTGHVIISGTCTMTTAGSVTLSGIQLQTNSAALLAVTGSAASIVNLNNCYLNCTNNTGITFSSSNAAATININFCEGNLGTTGIAFHSSSSTGNLTYSYCNLSNSGASVTSSDNSAGTINYLHTTSSNSASTSSGGIIVSDFSIFYSVNNNTALTLVGTGSAVTKNTKFTGGTASAVSVGAGTNLTTVYCDFNSTNTNAVTGAGGHSSNADTYSNTSQRNNVTTRTGGIIVGGYVAPSTGFVGERITANANNAGLSDSTPTNITNISLTSGVWDVTGMCIFYNAVTGTSFRLAISGTSATLGTGGINTISTPTAPTAVSDSGLTVVPVRVVLTSTTTYYLVAQANFTVGTCGCQGIITATRVG